MRFRYPKALLLTEKLLYAYISLKRHGMFAPWRSQNSMRIAWVSDYWKIIHSCTLYISYGVRHDVIHFEVSVHFLSRGNIRLKAISINDQSSHEELTVLVYSSSAKQ